MDAMSGEGKDRIKAPGKPVNLNSSRRPQVLFIKSSNFNNPPSLLRKQAVLSQVPPLHTSLLTTGYIMF